MRRENIAHQMATIEQLNRTVRKAGDQGFHPPEDAQHSPLTIHGAVSRGAAPNYTGMPRPSQKKTFRCLLFHPSEATLPERIDLHLDLAAGRPAHSPPPPTPATAGTVSSAAGRSVSHAAKASSSWYTRGRPVLRRLARLKIKSSGPNARPPPSPSPPATSSSSSDRSWPPQRLRRPLTSSSSPAILTATSAAARLPCPQSRPNLIDPNLAGCCNL